MYYLKTKYVIIGFLLLITNCIEPIDLKTITYEDFLVVEATITNEFKTQEVRLSRTFEIDNNVAKTESNASVVVSDSEQINYPFVETSPGVYTSSNPFSATENQSYTLHITTTDGRNYTSTTEKLTAITEIQQLTTKTETTAETVAGVRIYVESFNENNTANYYRYEFEETYKIAPPYSSKNELKIISDIRPFSVEIQEKNYEDEICYKTQYSKNILQTETASLSEDRVNFGVRFIANTDFIISTRYSILVKQYVQNFNAYNYYKTLNTLASSETVFTQTQPGFIAGNVISETDSNEKVIGFFEVSSVSEKRIFFNHEDVFTAPIPDFVANCDFVAPIIFDSYTQDSPLINLLKDNTHNYYRENDLGLSYLEGSYLLIPKICGDCRALGSNIKPLFWID
jgi:hypothetical protein